jgi:hypothetical protein
MYLLRYAGLYIAPPTTTEWEYLQNSIQYLQTLLHVRAVRRTQVLQAKATRST